MGEGVALRGASPVAGATRPAGFSVQKLRASAAGPHTYRLPPLFSLFCEPSRLTIPTFGRRADDRRLPLIWPENRAYFCGLRVL